ncbi:MAG: hypothetical protein KY461_05580, partial [Actinobacteria bacterium]|nr:hypothetical protein [Actinomycetota bacterium]
MGVAGEVAVPRRWSLADVDGHVRSADEWPVSHLLVFVERDCPTSQGALTALADSAAGLPAVVVVSQGRPQAAHDLVRACRADRLPVLVEPEPHPVSA